MSGQWQNVRNNNRRESRTPQNRSGTASPAQAIPSQPPKQQQENKDKDKQQAPNVWQQKATERQAAAAASAAAAAASGSNGPQRSEQPLPVSSPVPASESHKSINGFDSLAAKAFLSRNAIPPSYKASDARNSGSAWSSTSNMSNGQPFLKHLAREISKTEAGG